MATRIFGSNPDAKSYDVVEAVGPTATSAIVSIVVDLASNITDGSTTRGPTKREVLQALEYIKEHIIRKNTWPPA